MGRLNAAALLMALGLPLATFSAQEGKQQNPAEKQNSIEKTDPSPRLLLIKKLCVDKLVGIGAQGAEATEIAIASLFSSRRFTVTENCGSADAILKGAISQKTSGRVRSEGEGVNFRESAASRSGAGASLTAVAGAIAGGNDERLYSAESVTSATATLRVTDKNGDILWAHSTDSAGGKVKSAAADAIDRAVRQLLKDLDRAGK